MLPSLFLCPFFFRFSRGWVLTLVVFIPHLFAAQKAAGPHGPICIQQLCDGSPGIKATKQELLQLRNDVITSYINPARVADGAAPLPVRGISKSAISDFHLGGYTFAAYKNAELLGFIRLINQQEGLLIDGPYVAAKHQGCGIGKALIECLIKQCQAYAVFMPLRICVTPSEGDFIALLETLGFKKRADADGSLATTAEQIYVYEVQPPPVSMARHRG